MLWLAVDLSRGKMSRPKGKWQNVGRLCAVCKHEQRGRIDYLIVTADGSIGSGRRALAEKFGLTPDAIAKHGKNHISAEYRAAVLAGPFRSEDDLRQLAAEEGTSVLVNYRALFNAHRGRWLRALEIGDDDAMVKHARAMDNMLWRIGQLTREIAPHAPAIQTNVFMTADYYQFERRALSVLRRHPEALEDWLAEFREVQRPALIEVSGGG
jgi:hypothetical protein